MKTVLVVEDDSTFQSTVREALEGAGLQVMVEKDADWAQKALERRLPDLMITDLLLPTLSGLELIQRLRGMPGGVHVPVITMSGIYKSTRHKRQARDLGVVASFDKPFSLPEFVAAALEASGQKKKKAPALSTPPSSSSASPSSKRAADVVDDPLADFDQRLEKDHVESASSSFPAERTVRGNLKHKRFPEVLAQLYRWKSTGALLLRRGRIKKIVYLRDGYPIFVKSNLLSECLGRILVREKMITEAECEESLEVLKTQPGKQQGTILIERGALSPHNLVFGLQLQLEQKLFDIFSWPDGDYQFNAKIEIPTQAIHLDMSLATIVYEGVRRRFTDQQVSDLLEPFLDLYLGMHPEPSHRFQEIPLEADERTLVALIDGRRTMRDVVDRSGLPKKAAQKLVYSLFAAEMIQPTARKASEAQSAALSTALSTSTASSSPPPLPKKKDAAKPPAAAHGRQAATAARRRRHRPRQPRDGDHRRAAGPPRRARAAAQAPEPLRGPRRLEAREHRRDPTRVLRARERAAPRSPAALGDGRRPRRRPRLAEQIQSQLALAFETLSDERRRAEYNQKSEGAQKTPLSEDLTRLLGAETRFRKGDAALDAGRFDDAVKHFQDAVALYPDEGEFLAGLGWALFSRPPTTGSCRSTPCSACSAPPSSPPATTAAGCGLGACCTAPVALARR